MPNKRSKSKNAVKQRLNNKWKNPGKSNASTNPDRVLPGSQGNNSFYRSKVSRIINILITSGHHQIVEHVQRKAKHARNEKTKAETSSNRTRPKMVRKCADH